MTRTCSACGTANPEAATVCTACGKALAGERLPRKRPIWLWVAIAVIAILLAAPYLWRISQGMDTPNSPDTHPAAEAPATGG